MPSFQEAYERENERAKNAMKKMGRGKTFVSRLGNTGKAQASSQKDLLKSVKKKKKSGKQPGEKSQTIQEPDELSAARGSSLRADTQRDEQESSQHIYEKGGAQSKPGAGK